MDINWSKFRKVAGAGACAPLNVSFFVTRPNEPFRILNASNRIALSPLCNFYSTQNSTYRPTPADVTALLIFPFSHSFLVKKMSLSIAIFDHIFSAHCFRQIPELINMLQYICLDRCHECFISCT